MSTVTTSNRGFALIGLLALGITGVAFASTVPAMMDEAARQRYFRSALNEGLCLGVANVPVGRVTVFGEPVNTFGDNASISELAAKGAKVPLDAFGRVEPKLTRLSELHNLRLTNPRLVEGDRAYLQILTEGRPVYLAVGTEGATFDCAPALKGEDGKIQGSFTTQDGRVFTPSQPSKIEGY